MCESQSKLQDKHKINETDTYGKSEIESRNLFHGLDFHVCLCLLKGEKKEKVKEKERKGVKEIKKD